MFGLDIGTLFGRITVEDQFSSTFENFDQEMSRAGDVISKYSGIAVGALGAAAAAAAAYGASIVALGNKGSTLIGVTDAFTRLSAAVGETGDAMLTKLSAGVKDTVDGMDLMQAANRALSAGVKLTADDMQTLGATAREMAKAAGTDAASELNKLFTAMATGRTRALQLAGVTINLEQAERKFAASLGVSENALSREGKLQAARVAILEAARKKLDQLGESELTFKERIQQVQVAIGNWWDALSIAVAKSPEINKALASIADTIMKGLGEFGPRAIDLIVGSLERFAKIVQFVIPYVGSLFGLIRTGIEWVRGFWNWLVALNDQFHITDTIVTVAKVAFEFLRNALKLVEQASHAVVAAWREMPEWLQNIAATAVKAGLAFMAINVAVGAVQSPIKSFFQELDLGINIFGNLTGALVATNILWGNYAKQIGLATVATKLSTIATDAEAKAKLFLTGVVTTLGNTTTILTARIWLLETSEKAVVLVTNLWTAAKLRLAAVILAMNLNLEGLIARVAAFEVGAKAAALATGALGIAASAGSVAMTALGTAILAVKYVFLPLTVAWAAWQVGKKIGEIDAISDAFARWGAKILSVLGLLPQMTLAQIKASQESARLAKANEEAAKGLSGAADEAARLRDELSGARLQSDIKKLHDAFMALSPRIQDNADVMRRTGEQALALREQGGQLTPELNMLADAAAAARPKFEGLNNELDRFTNIGRRVKDAVMGIKQSQDGLLVQAQAWAEVMGKDPSSRTLAQQKQAFQALQAVVDTLGVDALGPMQDLWMRLNRSVGLIYENRETIRKFEQGQQNEQNQEAVNIVAGRGNEVGQAFIAARRQMLEWRRERELSGLYALQASQRQNEFWLQDQIEALDKSLGYTREYYKQVEAIEEQFRFKQAATLQQHNAAIAKQRYEEQFPGGVLIPPRMTEIEALKKAVKNSFGEALKDIPGMIEQAFTSGAGVKDAFKAIGVHLADAILQPLIESLGTLAKRAISIGASVAAAVGGKIGGGGGSVVGGLAGSIGGAALGATALGATAAGTGAAAIGATVAIGALTAGIGVAATAAFVGLKKLFNTAGRDMVVEFAKGLGGFDALRTRLNSLGAMGEQLWKKLTTVNKRDKEAAQRAIDDITAALERQEQVLARYNLTLDDVRGTGTDAGGTGSSFIDQLEADLQALVGMGITDYGNAWQQMADTAKRLTPKLADPLNEALRIALETGRKLPGTFEPWIRTLITSGKIADDLVYKLLGIPAPDVAPWKDMEEAAERYGIKLDSLGQRFKQSKFNDGVQQLIADWNLLVDNGADVNAVIDGMASKANKFLQEAKKWGLQVPESMRPMLEAMLRAGKLTDENGVKLDNLDDVNWGKDLTSAIADLIKKLDELIQKILGVPDIEVDTIINPPQNEPREDPRPGTPDEPTYDPNNPNERPTDDELYSRPLAAPYDPASPTFYGGDNVSEGLSSPVGGTQITLQQTNTITAWDGKSVDTFLREGGSYKIANATLTDIIAALERHQLTKI